MKDSFTGKWYGTSKNLFHEATYYATKTKTPFDVSNFFWDFYEVQKKGTGYVMGTLDEWRKLVPKGLDHLMPFIVRRTSSGCIDVGITRNKIFLTAPTGLRVSHPLTGILKNCRFQLDEADTKELQAIYPDFCYTFLSKFVRLPQIRDIDFFSAEDMVFMQKTEYNKMPLTDEPMMNFFTSNNSYSKWFKNDYNVLYSTSLIDIPEPLTQCEKLFDKNVLPIKKLVKDIGDLNNLTIKEAKNFFLYDDSNLISNTFFTELNKKIQCYGYISLLYNNSDEQLVNSKNRLKFNILVNIEKEFLMLQLEDILTPKKIETTDSKIKNFSILATSKINMKIIEEIKIEGFQNFEQYMRINPINIRIIDPEIQTKLMYYSKKCKYRFIANSLLFSSSIKEDTKVIFITANGLNDTKDILINDKIFQGIGIIYISEIEN